jgi:tRNA pseudouridine38-40 synthase
LCGRTAYPHEDRYIWQIWRGRPDIRTLNAYAAPLHGELNCSLFATPNDPAFTRGTKSPCRYITRAAWHYEADGLLIFNISANAFLWKMVRCIVGSLLYYEEKNMPLTEFAALLAEGDHRKAGPTAPAKGLFLTGVDY